MRVFYKLRLMVQYYTKQLLNYYHKANRMNNINSTARSITDHIKEVGLDNLNEHDYDKTGS